MAKLEDLVKDKRQIINRQDKEDKKLFNKYWHKCYDEAAERLERIEAYASANRALAQYIVSYRNIYK